ncbi:MAG: glycerophosphodiester phosphodiesterase family protein [Rubrimonas sp.]|uniref:glycerophosphodiester phosphodiesterase family protein n=1 Tax=Rubrimonas sp. TaxID=2036015 RepID=UPI002FDE1C17
MTLPPGFLRAPFAHRGLHDRAAGRVENSRAAADAAARAGYAVEIDVQLSSDGEAMVFHDATLERLTGAAGPLRARSAAELSRLPLRDGAETIPTLAEILAVLDGRTPLVVEVKDQGGALDGRGVGPLEARVAALLAAYPGPVAVMSFNPASVAALRDAAPALARGLVAGAPEVFAEDGAASERCEALAALEDFAAVGACFVSYDARALPQPRVAALRAAGAGVLSWTIRTPAQAAQVAPHVDAITFEGFLPAPGPTGAR